MCVTWLIHIGNMTNSHVWHDSFIWATWLIHVCDMTHSYGQHDQFICVTWLIHIGNMTNSHVWHDSFIWATWLIHTCDMTHSYVWHDSFRSRMRTHLVLPNCGLNEEAGRWLWEILAGACVFIHICHMTLHACEMTNSYAWFDLFTGLIHMCEETHSWLIHTYKWVMSHVHMSYATHVREMTYSYVWLDSFIRVRWLIRGSFVRMKESCHTYKWVTSHIRMSHVTHMNVWWFIHIVVTHSNVCEVTRSWLIHTNDNECGMSHSWFIYTSFWWMSHEWGDSFEFSWLIRMCVRWLIRDSFIRMTCVTHSNECGVTHSWFIYTSFWWMSHEWGDSFECSWLIRMCVRWPHESYHTYEWITLHILTP